MVKRVMARGKEGQSVDRVVGIADFGPASRRRVTPRVGDYHFGEPDNLHAKSWLHWDWNGRHLSNSSMSRKFVQIDHNFSERPAF